MTRDQALELQDALNTYPASIGSDQYDIGGIITVESGWNENAEADVDSPYGPSEGLMQIGWRLAVSQYGFTGDRYQLRDIRKNIDYGCRHLKWTFDYIYTYLPGLFQLYGGWYSAIVAYNCGVGNFATGNWTASSYVDKVIAARDNLRLNGKIINDIWVVSPAKTVTPTPTPTPTPAPTPTGDTVIDRLSKWQDEMNKVIAKNEQARPWPIESEYHTDIGQSLYNFWLTLSSLKARIFDWLGQIDNYSQPT